MDDKKSKIYCKFCKQLLEKREEIELGYHIACNESFHSNEFANSHKEIIKLLAKSLDLPEKQILDFIFKEKIKYKENEKGGIIDLQLIKTNLTTLNLSITGLEDLQSLTITNDYNEDHHEWCFWNEGLKRFPENITKLKKLKKLNLSGNSIKTLPESIGEMENLKELNLELNNLKLLPDTITKLSNLEILTLNYNPIETFPNNINHLINLKQLFLDFLYQFDPKLTLPSNFGYLPQLEELRIYSAFLEPLPESFSKLKNLHIFSLHGDYVRHKKSSISFQFLPENLIELDLSFISLGIIPDKIGNLTHLQKLTLANNSISTIPKAIMNLKKLKYLNLQGNKITQRSQKAKDNQEVNEFFENLKKENGFVIKLY